MISRSFPIRLLLPQAQRVQWGWSCDWLSGSSTGGWGRCAWGILRLRFTDIGGKSCESRL